MMVPVQLLRVRVDAGQSGFALLYLRKNLFYEFFRESPQAQVYERFFDQILWHLVSLGSQDITVQTFPSWSYGGAGEKAISMRVARLLAVIKIRVASLLIS